MAGIHRSSTLNKANGKCYVGLGMAGIHRSSTLSAILTNVTNRLGMAGIHRSSTLRRPAGADYLLAGDGRDSPLKYTWGNLYPRGGSSWGWPGFTAQVHFRSRLNSRRCALGMAGIHRSSTLQSRNGSEDRELGMAGIHRSSTLRSRRDTDALRLGMAGIHRSSTLFTTFYANQTGLGMAGIHRSSTLNPSTDIVESKAGDGRDSPLKYTFDGVGYSACSGWGWPGFTAQVHLLRSTTPGWRLLGMAGIHRSSTLIRKGETEVCQLGMAGIHRSSTLLAIWPTYQLGWGWPGFTAQVHLGRAELAEKQQVGAVSLFRKGGFAPGYLPARAVFCHKRPPFCQTDDL